MQYNIIGRQQSQMEQFSHMTDYSAMANPLWVSPYEGWDDQARYICRYITIAIKIPTLVLSTYQYRTLPDKYYRVGYH